MVIVTDFIPAARHIYMGVSSGFYPLLPILSYKLLKYCKISEHAQKSCYNLEIFGHLRRKNRDRKIFLDSNKFRLVILSVPQNKGKQKFFEELQWSNLLPSSSCHSQILRHFEKKKSKMEQALSTP